jgi:uncharacterized protein (TIGR03437 family)
MAEREFAPSVLVFNVEPFSGLQYQSFYVRDPGATATVDESCRSWLSVPSGSGARAVGVSPVAAPGSYSCTVSLARDGRPIGALRVILNIGPNAKAGTTDGLAFPVSMAFAQTLNQTAPSQTVAVNGDAYYATVTVFSPYAPFVAVPASLAPAFGKLTVSSPEVVNESANRQALYIETAAGVQVVPMTFSEVNRSVPRPDPVMVDVSYRAGGPPPAASVTITASSNFPEPVSVTSSAAWVRVSAPPTQVTPATYDLTFDASLLPNGWNTATLAVRSPPTSSNPVTVPVLVRVSGSSAVPGALIVSPASLTFDTAVGGPFITSQRVTVSAVAPTGYIASTAIHSGTTPWLRVSPATNLNTTSNPVLDVVIDSTGLSAGTYTGTVTVASTSTQFSRTIPVTLNVTAPVAPPPPALTVSPESVSIAHREGGPAPASATLQIAGTNGLAFTAQASSAGNWLTVTPAAASISGATTLTVSANPSTLAPGMHSGSILIQAAAGGPSRQVTVTLEITPPIPTVTGVVNAASYSAGHIAPGEIVTIFGENLGPRAGASLVLNDGKVANSVGGVEVRVGGFPAPILYAGERQVSAIVPYEIVSPFTPSPAILVRYRGQSSNGFPATQAASAPGIFTADSSGTGHGAILNGDFTPNSPERPAAPGEIVQIFVTGEGQTNPPGVTGKITTVSPTGPLTPQPLQRVAVIIDGKPATVHFYGAAPNLVAGLMQLNVEIPAGARPGEAAVVVTIGGEPDAKTSQAGVTVSVR